MCVCVQVTWSQNCYISVVGEAVPEVEQDKVCVVESELSEDAALGDSSRDPSSVPCTVTEEALCKLYKQLDDKVGIVWTHTAAL